MMRNKFLHGLVWGTVVGTLVGAIIGPMTGQQRKPFVLRGTQAIKDTTRNLMREAGRTRKRIMRRIG